MFQERTHYTLRRKERRQQCRRKGERRQVRQQPGTQTETGVMGTELPQSDGLDGQQRHTDRRVGPDRRHAERRVLVDRRQTYQGGRQVGVDLERTQQALGKIAAAVITRPDRGQKVQGQVERWVWGWPYKGQRQGSGDKKDLLRQKHGRPTSVSIDFVITLAAILGTLLGVGRAYLTTNPSWLLVSLGAFLTCTIVSAFAIYLPPKGSLGKPWKRPRRA